MLKKCEADSASCAQPDDGVPATGDLRANHDPIFCGPVPTLHGMSARKITAIVPVTAVSLHGP